MAEIQVDELRRDEGARRFLTMLPLPAAFVDRARGVYLANPCLLETFGYRNLEEAESRLRDMTFLTSHFGAEAVAGFYETLNRNGGRLENWLMRGHDRGGRELTLELTARGLLRSPQGPAEFVAAVFLPPGQTRDEAAFRQEAQKETELATQAKNEFLANISHELRTPLNIIIGMLALALEDETADEDLKENLCLAKEAADGLFTTLNDLIVLSHLSARRLVSDMAQFSPRLLLETLTRQFAAQAGSRGLALRTETDHTADTVLDGGYNLIRLALEKLLHNALKFAGDGGEILLRARVERRPDGPWLDCAVADRGPGLGRTLLEESPELFRQGDGSMNRRYGGLGVGLRLTGGLVETLGGELRLANREGGGAEIGFQIPVKDSAETGGSSR